MVKDEQGFKFYTLLRLENRLRDCHVEDQLLQELLIFILGGEDAGDGGSLGFGGLAADMDQLVEAPQFEMGMLELAKGIPAAAAKLAAIRGALKAIDLKLAYAEECLPSAVGKRMPGWRF